MSRTMDHGYGRRVLCKYKDKQAVILCESGKEDVGSNRECEGVFYRVFAGTKDGARVLGQRDR